MMKVLIVFLLQVFLLNPGHAQIPGIEIKNILENHLKTNYLQSLEQQWGKCAGDPESCLLDQDDYKIVNLPKKESCFPYTVCGFYDCMEQKYECSTVGIDYFTKLARPTCNAYVKNIQAEKFSKLGVE